jgi:hypothetical protein
VYHAGSYPLCENGSISALAEFDRGRIDEFFGHCNAGVTDTSLVTNIKQLATSKDLTNLNSEGYCTGIADAFVNPHTYRQEHVQMSAQFGGIVLSRDNKTITFRLSCNYHRPSFVTLTGSDVYSSFEKKCNEIKLQMRRIREVYASAPSSARMQVDIHTTYLAGHKLWVRTGDGEFVTLYLVRHTSLKRRNIAHKLMIVAADICVLMPNEEKYEAPTLECAICLEEVSVACWKCVRCSNRLHTECVASWKQNPNASCPFCRTPL